MADIQLEGIIQDATIESERNVPIKHHLTDSVIYTFCEVIVGFNIITDSQEEVNFSIPMSLSNSFEARLALERFKGAKIKYERKQCFEDRVRGPPFEYTMHNLSIKSGLFMGINYRTRG